MRLGSSSSRRRGISHESIFLGFKTLGIDIVTTGQSSSSLAPVAVVSDGSGLVDPGKPELDSVLREYARLLQDLGGPPARDFLTDTRDTNELVDALRALPEEVRAVYLVHTDAARGSTVQRHLGKEFALLSVVTDQDVAAIVLAAKLLTTLRRRGRETAASQVVVAEGSIRPNLGPLLMAVRIFDISFWKEADAPVFPLERVARGTDAVIDLRTEQHDELQTLGETGPAILKLDDIAGSIAPLPGLLNVIVDAPLATVDIDIYAAVSQALSTMTPPDKDFPGIDRALADSVGWAARQAMLHPRSHFSESIPKWMQ